MPHTYHSIAASILVCQEAKHEDIIWLCGLLQIQGGHQDKRQQSANSLVLGPAISLPCHPHQYNVRISLKVPRCPQGMGTPWSNSHLCSKHPC